MGTTIPTVINGIRGEASRLVNGMTTDTLTAKMGLGLNLLAPLEPYKTGEDKIDSNESLTEVGRREARIKLVVSETLRALGWIRDEVKKMQEKDQRYRTQFYTIDSGMKDPAERMPIFTYVWGNLDRLEPAGRITQFLLAAEQNNLVVMAAMLQNPLGLQVDEETKNRALDQRAKQLFPQDYDNFEQNAILLEFLIMARDWIARWLFREIGLEIQVIRGALGDEAVADLPAA